MSKNIEDVIKQCDAAVPRHISFMAQRSIQFANGEIYHLVMRAIDGLGLFRDNRDYLRMIHDLFEFNNSEATSSAM